MIWRVIITAAALSIASAAQGETVLNRAYGFDKLDAFWGSTLGSSAPDSTAFAMFEAAAAPPPVEEAPIDLGVPIIGDILGEDATVPAQTQTLTFPVIPLSAEAAGPIMRRLAWAELYLSRYAYYAAASTETAAQIDALTARQQAAAAEAYLAVARLYYAAPDLGEKCTRLTRLQALAAGPLATRGAVDALPGWADLIPLQKAAAARLGDTALTSLVCAVNPVRGRGETVKRITTRVQDTLAFAARAKVEDALILLEAAAAEFQALVNAMDVEIKTAEILELERVFGNAASNLRLVKTDQLRAEDTLAALEAVDLGQLNQPGEMAEFQAAQAQLQAMVMLMDEVLSALEPLHAVDPDALAPCAGLEALYDAPDLTLDSGTLTQRIEAPYVACLGAAQGVVEVLTGPTLQSELMAELARHVGQISENLVESMRP